MQIICQSLYSPMGNSQMFNVSLCQQKWRIWRIELATAAISQVSQTSHQMQANRLWSSSYEGSSSDYVTSALCERNFLSYASMRAFVGQPDMRVRLLESTDMYHKTKKKKELPRTGLFTNIELWHQSIDVFDLYKVRQYPDFKAL